jgi:hypothetical protein
VENIPPTLGRIQSLAVVAGMPAPALLDQVVQALVSPATTTGLMPSNGAGPAPLPGFQEPVRNVGNWLPVPAAASTAAAVTVASAVMIPTATAAAAVMPLPVVRLVVLAVPSPLPAALAAGRTIRPVTMPPAAGDPSNLGRGGPHPGSYARPHDPARRVAESEGVSYLMRPQGSIEPPVARELRVDPHTPGAGCSARRWPCTV